MPPSRPHQCVSRAYAPSMARKRSSVSTALKRGSILKRRSSLGMRWNVCRVAVRSIDRSMCCGWGVYMRLSYQLRTSLLHGITYIQRSTEGLFFFHIPARCAWRRSAGRPSRAPCSLPRGYRRPCPPSFACPWLLLPRFDRKGAWADVGWMDGYSRLPPACDGLGDDWMEGVESERRPPDNPAPFDCQPVRRIVRSQGQPPNTTRSSLPGLGMGWMG